MDADFDIRYTDRPITPFGGLTTVTNFYQNSGLQDVISSLPLPQPGSNRGYDPVDIIEGFLVSVILGARRLAHAGLLRHDKVVSEMFGWSKGMASESTFSRFFKKFDVDLNDELFIELNRWWFTKLKVKHHTVDIDSIVITRYGNQDGVEVGYNPRKPGRGSHHPLIAFAAEARMVIQSWMRTGDSVCSTNIKDFIAVLLKTLDKSSIGLVRADSGFFSETTLGILEGNKLKYIVAAKMYANLVQEIFEADNWIPYSDGIDICSIECKLKGWDHARRIVVVRKSKSEHPNNGGKSLFEEYDEFSTYLYSAFLTDLELVDRLIWDLYRHRAETQIRELKESYGLEGFCRENFGATEAAFRWVCVAYNLMSLYKIALINSKHDPTLATLKFHCIAIVSYLVRLSRKTTLVMSVNNRRRAFFDGLFQKIENIKPQSKFLLKKKFLMN
ncbi:MAG: IS1380 family transposase [Bacteroidota bacterium]|nr:IS1380 family transposase [Bacteroidota bacterium]